MTYEEMLALQQANSRPRFTDYLSLIMGGAGLVGQGLQGSRDARLQEQDIVLRERAEQYAREERARAARLAFEAGRSGDDFDRASVALGAQPLGNEQGYVQRQGLIGNMIGQMQLPQPTLAGGPITDPFAGLSREPWSPASTASALAARRRALAAVNPDINFGSLADFGLGDAATSADADVAAAVAQARARRQAQDDATRALLDAQTAAAQAYAQTQPSAATTSTVAPKKKKGGFWSKLGKIISVAAPIIAAPFTGGASLAAIGAGAGALGGLASGGGLKGALLGAGMGAIPVSGAAGAGRVAGESAAAAVRRAVLNPAALARLSGAAVGGPAEVVANLAAPFLPGMQPGVGPTVNRVPSLPGASPMASPMTQLATPAFGSPFARPATSNFVPLNDPRLRVAALTPSAPRMRNVVAPKLGPPVDSSILRGQGPMSVPFIGDRIDFSNTPKVAPRWAPPRGLLGGPNARIGAITNPIDQGYARLAQSQAPNVIQQMTPAQLAAPAQALDVAAAIEALALLTGATGGLGAAGAGTSLANAGLTGAVRTSLGPAGPFPGKMLDPQGVRLLLDGLKSGQIPMTPAVRTLLDRFARATLAARQGTPWR